MITKSCSTTPLIIARVSAQSEFINARYASFTIKLIFSDVDNNEYYQLVKRENTGRYMVSEPKAMIDKV